MKLVYLVLQVFMLQIWNAQIKWINVINTVIHAENVIFLSNFILTRKYRLIQ